MTRVCPHGVLSLAGCLLAASLVCGGPVVAHALTHPGADGRPLALTGTPPRPSARVHTGLASWYGTRWQGRRTASGARYDRHQLTAAHRTAPFGTEAVVTNLANGHVVRVRITDRGPHTRQRILDLSYAAARQLDMLHTGTTRVQVEWLTTAPPRA
jgi:rare lipoprotein A